MIVAIGSDHAGYEYKVKVVEFLKTLGYEVLDLGCDGPASVDYPDFGAAVGNAVVQGKAEKGIVICGSGIGISIAANKVNGVRCALCHDHLSASLCRQHNDANVVSMGARLIGIEVAFDIVKTFLETPFEGGRHQKRIDKISALEQH